MSLFSILSTARSGLLAHQATVETASHNIANVATEGYSRQRVRLAAATPLRTPDGQIGRGVQIQGVERTRSAFLDAALRTELSRSGEFDATAEQLSQIEGVMGDLGPGGLGATIDRFFDAFSDLAANPPGIPFRTAARQATVDLVNGFRNLYARTSDIGARVQERLQAAVTEVNQLTAEIADLNVKIQSGNGEIPDLGDARDLALEKLSKLVDTKVVEGRQGSVTVLIGGTVVADLGQSSPLELKTDGVRFGIGRADFPGMITLRGGEVRGLSQVLSTDLPGMQGKLNDLAASIVGRVNALHAAGQTNAGTTGVNLFDPAGTTAATIGLSTDVQTSIANLVTGTTDAPGDNTVALQISRVRTENQVTLGGRSFGGFYESIVLDVSGAIKTATDGVTAQEALVGQIRAQRASVKDVSQDEEMLTLIKAQQSYSAAAKVVTTADQMMQAILQMV